MCCNNCPSKGCKARHTHPPPHPNPHPHPHPHPHPDHPLPLTTDPSPMSLTPPPPSPHQDCPMYGVGLNPVYQARLEEREAKREASGASLQA